MKPEDAARQKIDNMLCASGWEIQDYDRRNISLPGVAVREFPTNGRKEPVDYALFANGDLVGIIEAKKEGEPLTMVETQSSTYMNNLRQSHNPVFAYETTGIETYFCDMRDPNYRSRSVFTFHPPASLHEMYKLQDTLRARLRNNIPPELPASLRNCQRDAIESLENALGRNQQKALIHMTMGSGKTYMMVTQSYRLLKFTKAKRILFLVDRRELGRQAFAAYDNYIIPEENRKFTDMYNVQHLTGRHIEETSAVVISTIQRLYSIMSGTEYADEEDETSMFEKDEDGQEKIVQYNEDMPIDMFDFVVIDEAHRSIYGTWRQVLEYFDAFLVGLTATPQDYTLTFFGRPVSKYTMRESVKDGINVEYSPVRVLTKMNTEGVFLKEGEDIMQVDRATGKKTRARVRKDERYTPEQLDRKIEAEGHIQVVIEELMHIQDENFGRPEYVPKTLVFAKTTHHADTITRIIRKVYGKGNEFCRPITSKVKNPDAEIRSFRQDVPFRIAVVVDMLSTGFDMPALECLLFMRRVESPAYAEQMMGRGCRVISDDKLNEATPDAVSKDFYLIVDATGALDALGSDKRSKLPLHRNIKNLERVMNDVADGKATRADLEALANKLNILKKRMSKETSRIVEEAAGMNVDGLVDAIRVNTSTNNYEIEAKKKFGDEPTQEQLNVIKIGMLKEAAEPFFNPELRNAILEAAKQDALIVTAKLDELVGTHVAEVQQPRDRFVEFLHKNRDRYIALQIIYGTPYRLQKLTFEHLNELADAIKQPPYNLTPEKIWKVYEKLDRSKVRSSSVVRLTDMISLIRYVAGEQDMLMPYGEFVMEKFEKWLETQRASGGQFTPEQETWLRKMAKQISVSCKITEDIINTAFYDEGGLAKFYKLFPEGGQMLGQLHKELTNFEE